MSDVFDVLGFRVVMVMRLCKRHGRCSNRSDDKDCKDFLQNIVHGTNLMGESLMASCFGRILKCRDSVSQRFFNLEWVNKTRVESVV